MVSPFASTWDVTLPSPPQSAAMVTFRNTAPGALRDLVKWLALGEVVPGRGLLTLDLHTTSTGPLHALAGISPHGAPGKLIITQIGVLLSGGPAKGATGDGFPVERVKLRAIGR